MSLTVAPQPTIQDQARVLRELIERHAALTVRETAPRCRTIAVVSGKGGVGKSVVSLNLAVSIARNGHSVCLIDANPRLGSLDLLCGLNGYWNLSHVVTGSRELKDVVLRGPAEIELLPGASALAELNHCPAAVQNSLSRQLEDLERRNQVLIVDTGSGLDRVSRRFAMAADQLLIVTTPEPTSIADAYATVKAFCAVAPSTAVLVNRADSPEAANRISERLRQTARVFLQANVESWGWLPSDPAVAQSVMARQPFVLHQPQSPAAKAMSRLATHCLAGRSESPISETYFGRLTQQLT